MEKATNEKDNSQKKIFLLLFLYSTIIVGIFFIVDLLFYKYNSQTQFYKEALKRYEYKNDFLKTRFDEKSKLLIALKESNEFNIFLENKNFTHISELFFDLTNSKPNIMQLRYINKEGFEEIRVDRQKYNSTPYLVKQDKLQDKSSRYYFKNSINKKDIWISNIDLNIENNLVQVPYVPTVRVVLPIWKNGTFNGILVANYFMEESLNQFLKDILFDLYLLDKNGSIIVSSDKSANWEAYEGMTTSYLKQAFDMTFEEFLRNTQEHNYLLKNMELNTKDPIYLLLMPKSETMKNVEKEKLEEFLVISLIVFVLSLLFMYLMGKVIYRILEKIQKQNQDLEFITLELTHRNNELLKKENEFQNSVKVAITEKNRAQKSEQEAISFQKELQIKNKELLSSQQKIEKLAKAKETFLANMSHEIRTPLNGIKGITEILLDHPNSDEYIINNLNTLKKSSSILVNIVNDILDFSSLESGNMKLFPKEFSLREMIEHLENTLIKEFEEKEVSFNIDISDDVEDTLIADELRLSQILLNLLGNSKKFTKKGFVSLGITTVKKDNERINLRIVVSDTGIGMTKDVKDNLFTSFTQGDYSNTKEYKGTGLGLVIVKNLIELMNGKINVSSIENSGTTFRIYLELPYSKNILDQKNKDNFFVLDKIKKALLVEDDETNQIVLKAALEKRKFDVSIVSNGLEAIASVKENDYDIVSLWIFKCQ